MTIEIDRRPSLITNKELIEKIESAYDENR